MKAAPGIKELEAGGSVGFLPHQPLQKVEGVAEHLQEEVFKVMWHTVLAHDFIDCAHGQHTQGLSRHTVLLQ